MMKICKKLIAWTTLLAVAMLSVLPAATSVFAQNYTTSRLKCPDYQFTRTLAQGSRGEDVRLIQTILNLDYRTRVAPSGVGSRGYETDLYGVATREALKRFQALFIELIGIADGKFNNRTLTVMNAVCQGNYFKNGIGGVYDNVGSATTTQPTVNKDTTGPVITISAPTPGYTDESFRLWIVANEPIQAFSLDKFIILGGATLSDLRKENPTTYKVLVTPSKATSHSVSLQLEAESIRDLSGNLNPNASNELTLSLSPRPAGPDVTPPSATLISGSLGVMTINNDGSIGPVNVTLTFSEAVTGNISLSNFVVRGAISLSDLKKLDSTTYSFVVNSSATDRATGSIQLPAGLVTDGAGNKNTVSNEYQFNILKIPAPATTTAITNQTPTYTPGYTDSGNNNNSSQSDPMNMLMYLMMGSKALEGLKSLFGSNPFTGATNPTSPTSETGSKAITDALSQGGKNIGGTITPNGYCACQSAPTGLLSKVSGDSPIPGTYTIIGVPAGEYIGIRMPPPTICGVRFRVSSKDTCPGIPGMHNAMCCGINLNSTMQPVVGALLKVN